MLFLKIFSYDFLEFFSFCCVDSFLERITDEFCGLVDPLFGVRKAFVRDAFKKYINVYIDSMVPIIQQGIDSGEFRQVDPLDVAISTGAIIEGTVLLWVYDHQLVKPDEHIRKGTQLLLSGVQI